MILTNTIPNEAGLDVALVPTAGSDAAKQRSHGEAPVAQALWGRISQGSLFHQSEVGRHLAIENLLVQIDGRGLYVAVAYFTGDRGERTEALVHPHLFSRPPCWEPTQIDQWESPIHSEAFFPQALVRALPIVISLTREFVQREGRLGWQIQRWLDVRSTIQCAA